jgi:hypothetical protein
LKRIIVALALAGMVFGGVYALAAVLSVGDGTASSGSGDIGEGCSVTGSTYVLEGQTVGTGDDGGDIVTGTPTDISQFTHVNIETSGCDFPLNVFIEVKDGNGGTGNTIASGTCEIRDGDGTDEAGDGGLGADEDDDNDNVEGCTAGPFAPADVVDAESLVVTET